MKKTISNRQLMALCALAFIDFAGVLTETALNVSFPILGREFNVNIDVLQWLTTANILVMAIVTMTSAFLMNKFNSRVIWEISLMLFFVGSIMGWLATNIWIVILGRILQGASAGLASPLLFNYITAIVPMSKLGLWLGSAGMILNLAPSFGPTYGGILDQWLGWRSIFYLTMLFPILSVILGWKNIQDIRSTTVDEQSNDFNVIAFLALSIFLTAVLVSLNLQHGSALINGSVIGITLVVFIYSSLKSKRKLLNIKLLGNLNFVLLLAACALNMIILLGFDIVIPMFLQGSQHSSASVSGFVLLPGSLLGALLSPLVGRVYDVYGAKWLMFLGNIQELGALTFGYFFTQKLIFPVMMLFYTVVIVGRTMVTISAQTKALADVSEVDRPDATAILQTTVMVFATLGTTLGAKVINNFGTTLGLKAFNLVSIVILVLIFAATILFFIRIKVKTDG